MSVLDEAKARGFMVDKSRGYTRFNAWWEWCREADHPFILVSLKRKWAEVRMDLFAQSFRLSPAGCDAIKDIVLSVPRHGDAYWGDCTTVFMVAKDDAESVARRLLSVAHEYRRSYKEAYAARREVG